MRTTELIESARTGLDLYVALRHASKAELDDLAQDFDAGDWRAHFINACNSSDGFRLAGWLEREPDSAGGLGDVLDEILQRMVDDESDLEALAGDLLRDLSQPPDLPLEILLDASSLAVLSAEHFSAPHANLAIDFATKAKVLSTSRSDDYVDAISLMARGHYQVFRQFRTSADLDQAIDLVTDALENTPPDDTVGDLEYNLAVFLSTRYEESASRSDLDRSLGLLWPSNSDEELELDVDAVETLVSLLRERYLLDGDRKDLDNSARFGEVALEEVAEESPGAYGLRAAVVSTLIERFSLAGEEPDLDRVIVLMEVALRAKRDDAEVDLVAVEVCADAYAARYERNSQREDLDRATELVALAMTRLQSGDEGHEGWLVLNARLVELENVAGSEPVPTRLFAIDLDEEASPDSEFAAPDVADRAAEPKRSQQKLHGRPALGLTRVKPTGILLAFALLATFGAFYLYFNGLRRLIGDSTPSTLLAGALASLFAFWTWPLTSYPFALSFEARSDASAVLRRMIKDAAARLLIAIAVCLSLGLRGWTLAAAIAAVFGTTSRRARWRVLGFAVAVVALAAADSRLAVIAAMASSAVLGLGARMILDRERTWPAPVPGPRRGWKHRRAARQAVKLLSRGFSMEASTEFLRIADDSSGDEVEWAVEVAAYASSRAGDLGRVLECGARLSEPSQFMNLLTALARERLGDHEGANQHLNIAGTQFTAWTTEALYCEVAAEIGVDDARDLLDRAQGLYAAHRCWFDCAAVTSAAWARAVDEGDSSGASGLAAQWVAVLAGKFGGHPHWWDAAASAGSRRGRLETARFSIVQRERNYEPLGEHEPEALIEQLRVAGLHLQVATYAELLARESLDKGDDATALKWYLEAFEGLDAQRYRFAGLAERAYFVALNRRIPESALRLAVALQEHKLVVELLEFARAQTVPNSTQVGLNQGGSEGTSIEQSPALAAAASATGARISLRPAPRVSVGGRSRIRRRRIAGAERPPKIELTDTLRRLGGSPTWWLSYYDVGDDLIWALAKESGHCQSGIISLDAKSMAGVMLTALTDATPGRRPDEPLFDYESRRRSSFWLDASRIDEEQRFAMGAGELLLPAPLRSSLVGGEDVATVFVSPSPRLGMIPFPLLGLDRLADGTLLRLVHRARLINGPSLALVEYSSTPSEPGLHPLSLIVADSVGGLVHARRSVELADPGTTVLGGVELPATRSRVLAELSKCRPASTALIAGHHEPGMGSGGIVTASVTGSEEVLNAVNVISHAVDGGKVPRRVVLSCCDSADIAASTGDEWLGVAPAMVFAGAQQVFATVFPLEDSEDLATFERSLVESVRDASDPVESLRLLQVDALRRWADPTERRTPPIVWGGFTTVGQPGTVKAGAEAVVPRPSQSLLLTYGGARDGSRPGGMPKRPITTFQLLAAVAEGPLMHSVPIVLLLPYLFCGLVLGKATERSRSGESTVLTSPAKRAIELASGRAATMGSDEIEMSHLFGCLVAQKGTSAERMWRLMPARTRHSIESALLLSEDQAVRQSDSGIGEQRLPDGFWEAFGVDPEYARYKIGEPVQ